MCTSRTERRAVSDLLRLFARWALISGRTTRMVPCE
jgi:hypothetical protein